MEVGKEEVAVDGQVLPPPEQAAGSLCGVLAAAQGEEMRLHAPMASALSK